MTNTFEYDEFKANLIEACENGFYLVLKKIAERVKDERAEPILREIKRDFQAMLLKNYTNLV